MEEALDFGPRKALLVLWIIWSALVSLALGGGTAAICAESDVPPLAGFIVGFLLSWIILSFSVTLYFKSIRYHLDERYVTKSCGVVWKERRSIPLEKITNIDVRQGPVERLLGFGQIWIFTPSTGSMTPEQKLVGVSSPHQMKDTIIERTERARSPKTRSTAVSTTDGAADEGLLVLRDIRDSLARIEKLLSKADESVR